MFYLKGAEIIEHEFKYCECDNARTLVTCPGKQRIFLVVCAKFFQVIQVVCIFNLLNFNLKEEKKIYSII